MRSLSPSLIFVCTRTVSPTRNSGTRPRASGFTFLCSTNSIAFARIFAPLLRTACLRGSYWSLKTPEPSSFFSFEQPPVLGREGKLLEEVGAPLTRPQERLPPAPARDTGVIAAQERLRDAHPAKFRRPCVLRPLQQHLAAERLPSGALLVSEHPGNEPRDRLEDRQRADFAALQDEVTERQLL